MSQNAEAPVKPGDILVGKYRVDRVLGIGNMGIVVAAEHIGLLEKVALKFMLPTKGPQTEQHARFLREARACAKLKTQHVAKVTDVGTMENGAPYMAMEFLDGRDLDAIVADRGPLPIPEAVGYILQACMAFAEAHAAGIVHRDIKPANLFLAKGSGGVPCIKVLDFGISKLASDQLKLTSDQTALGSPLYMSPEHIKSSATVDARADIWSLGVTLYELVAGKTPFDATRIDALCANILFGVPTPLSTHRQDAPQGFEAALMRCLEKDPGNRYQDVAQLAAALEPFAPPRETSRAALVASALGVAAPSSPNPSSSPNGLPSTQVVSAATNVAAATGSGVAGTVRSPTGLSTPKARLRAPAAALVTLAVAAATAVGVFVVRPRIQASVPHSAAPAATTATAAPTSAPPTAAPTAMAEPAQAEPTQLASAPAPTTSATAEPTAKPATSASAPLPKARPPVARPEPEAAPVAPRARPPSYAIPVGPPPSQPQPVEPPGGSRR